SGNLEFVHARGCIKEQGTVWQSVEVVGVDRGFATGADDDAAASQRLRARQDAHAPLAGRELKLAAATRELSIQGGIIGCRSGATLLQVRSRRLRYGAVAEKDHLAARP